MKTVSLLFATLLMTVSPTSALAATPVPPDAAKKPHVVEAPFGAQRNDDYYWLRDDDRKNPEMLAYLNAENAYADAVLAPTKPLQEKLYGEIVGRIKQDDASVPYRDRGWWYYARYEAGKDYPVHARRRDGAGVDALAIQRANAAADFADERVLLNVNALAQGHDYYSVGDYQVSQDNRLLAYADDSNGRRQYTVRFKDLETGRTLPDAIPNVEPNLVWADDDKTLFYIEKDPETLLSVRVKKHVLGTPVEDDALVYEEKDDSFYMGIGRTRDDRYIVIGLDSTVSSECRYAPAADPSEFVVLAPRERDLEYDADHFDGQWVIRTNADGAKNFKIVVAPSGATSRMQWTDWVAHDDKVFIEGIELFDGFAAIDERSDGLTRIRLLRKDGTALESPHADVRGFARESQYVQADEPAYAMESDATPETDTPWLRYSYTSLTTPATTYELNVVTGERRLLKQQPVPGYDPSQYVTERLWIDARDGAKVPVSLVYRAPAA
ncbi:MAG: hypothetical protein QM594_04130, partial [Niabella sp.]